MVNWRRRIWRGALLIALVIVGIFALTYEDRRYSYAAWACDNLYDYASLYDEGREIGCSLGERQNALWWLP